MENADIRIKKLNATYCVVLSSSGILQEIADKFVFTAPNAKYDWRFKKRLWDGQIRLFNRQKNTIYVGLIGKIKEFARKKHYSLYSEYDDHSEIRQYYPSDEDVEIFYSKHLTKKMQRAQDQVELLQLAIQEKRATMIAPTGSGKSFLMFLLAKFWNKKTLVICPSVNLVRQTQANFKDYDPNYECMVTTWQGLQRIDKDFFYDFETVIVDECHGAKATVIKSILEHCVNAVHRYGFTGTTDDVPVNELVIEGLFGRFLKNRTTSQLVDEGRLAKPKIKCILLEYPEEERKKFWKDLQTVMSEKDRKENASKKYNIESKFLISHEKRQEMLIKIISEIKGSTFVLFRNISHGQEIYNSLYKVRSCEFVYGITDGDKREEIRVESNNDPNSCVVASYGVFSTGVDVPELRNVVFASPYKSKIKVLQSIGRVIRKTASKSNVMVYDIVDDLTVGKKMNYAVKHFVARVKLYEQEKFDYEVIRVKL